MIIFLSRLVLNLFLVKLKTLACFLNLMVHVLLKQLEAQDGRIHLFAISKRVQDVQDNTSETRGILENYSQHTLAPGVYEAKTKSPLCPEVGDFPQVK